MSDAVRINGNMYSWASIEVHIGGQPYGGVTALNYSQNRERTQGYGTGNHRGARGRTKGKYTAEGSLTMHADSYDALIDALAQLSPDGQSYGDVEFLVVAQYVEDTLRPVTIELERCVIDAESTSESEGTDPSVVEVTLNVMRIRRNGKSLAAGEIV